MNKFRTLAMAALIGSVAITSCKKDSDLPVVPPAQENELEVITDVRLIFTNTANANDTVVARAQDPDGAGVMELAILDTINLDINKTYVLTYEIMNNLEAPGEDIGAEILAEADEHQLFYAFTNNAFANPTGDGNADNAADAINYNDMDGSGNPLGLSTNWTTAGTSTANGSFTVTLKHQPGVKSATSTINDGETDFALQFVMNIQ